ncbi:MAG: DNA polymerase III subunit delta [Lachnospiraceae bacterium]|nr:DNA polymerase III subunit delta [Lachnospiraceae bacterium]
MNTFEDIIGQDEMIGYFKRSMKNESVSHALIIDGERHSGKKFISRIAAVAMQCENEEKKPCGVCRSCKMAEGLSHPDIITLKPKKENARNVLSVDDIREQLNSDIGIKPYYSKNKIYIIPNASGLNVQGQNALLKTLEEPPEYAHIILLADNREDLLPTILSRCVCLTIKPIATEKIRAYLENVGISGKMADIAIAFSRGSIGRAQLLSSDEIFSEILNDTIAILMEADKLPMTKELEFIRKITDNKELVNDYLDILRTWYRDVLVYKATSSEEDLIFINERAAIIKTANFNTYEELNKVVNAIDETKDRLKANGNLSACMGLLLDTMKEKH